MHGYRTIQSRRRVLLRSLPELQHRMTHPPRPVMTSGHPVRDVEAGDLVVLSQNLGGPAEALEDATIQAVVAWPDGAGDWDAELAGGRT